MSVFDTCIELAANIGYQFEASCGPSGKQLKDSELKVLEELSNSLDKFFADNRPYEPGHSVSIKRMIHWHKVYQALYGPQGI